MTDPDYTALLMIVDHSGSMMSIRDASEEAVNGFIASQRPLPGRCTIRLHEFDDEINVVYPSTDVHETPPYQLVPRGMTALLDAIGHGIDTFGDELAAAPEDQRPGKVAVVIQTDGQENASHEHKLYDVAAKIGHQRDVYGWEFVFLGANIDAIATAAALKIPAHSSITYAASAAGTHAVGHSTSDYVSTLRAGRKAAFSDADREAAQDAGTDPRP